MSSCPSCTTCAATQVTQVTSDTAVSAPSPPKTPPTPNTPTTPCCRICHSGVSRERLLSPCHCKGSLAHVHRSCLEQWLNQAGRQDCELCLKRYDAIETRRYRCCESALVWLHHPRNRSHLQADFLIGSLLTVVTVGLVVVCLLGMRYFILEGMKVGITHIWTRGAIAVFLAVVVVGYVITLYLLVSWIRKRDLHILTAGILTYTSDQRFQVIRPDKSDNWTLQIKFPQRRDAGIYECQVNTEPKMSLAFRLNVVESKARILGPAELYVKSGSAVSVTCVISQGPHDLGTVFWYRDSHVLEPSGSPPGDRIRVDTDWTEALTSRLRIAAATPADSGNYSCVPTVAAPASVNVHVINGEHPAAMQHGNKNAAVVREVMATYVVTLVLVMCTNIR